MLAQSLSVEGGPEDLRLTQGAFRAANREIHLQVANSVLTATVFLNEGPNAKAPRTNQILVDLDMPGVDRRDFPARTKHDFWLTMAKSLRAQQSGAKLSLADWPILRAFDIRRDAASRVDL
jgi:hypothetical protein